MRKPALLGTSRSAVEATRASWKLLSTSATRPVGAMRLLAAAWLRRGKSSGPLSYPLFGPMRLAVRKKSAQRIIARSVSVTATALSSETDLTKQHGLMTNDKWPIPVPAVRS